MSVDIQTYPSNLSASGRFGRLAYLGWSMLLGLVAGFIIVLLLMLMPSLFSPTTDPSTSVSIGLVVMGLAFYIALVYFNFVFTIRRLHDRNHTGWMSLLMLIPFFNLLFVIYLCCAKGDAAANNYGAPHLTKTWEKVLGWIYITLFPIAMLGIVAAIGIPAYQSYLQKVQQAQQEQIQMQELIQMQQQQYSE